MQQRSACYRVLSAIAILAAHAAALSSGDLEGKQKSELTILPPISISLPEDPDWAEANRRIKSATQGLKSGDYPLALGECIAAIDVAPKTPSGHAPGRLLHLLGKIYLEEGDYKQALKVMRSINTDPKESYWSPAFDIDYAMVLAKCGYYAESVKHVLAYTEGKRGIGLGEKQLPGLTTQAGVEANVHLARGMLLCNSGDDEQAIAELKSVLKVCPKNAHANYYLANVYLRQKKLKEGLNCLIESQKSASGDLLRIVEIKIKNVRRYVQ